MSIRKTILVTLTIRTLTVILDITCTHTHSLHMCLCVLSISVHLEHVSCYLHALSGAAHCTWACARVTMMLPDNVGVMFNIACVTCLFNGTPGNTLQLFRVSVSVCTRRDAKPLGPQPDLTNDNCFTSHAAEGASRSKSHFETHSSKHFGPVLVGYSGERGSGAVKRRSIKSG